MQRLRGFLRGRFGAGERLESILPLLYASLAGLIAGLAAVGLVESVDYVHEHVFVQGREELPFGAWSIVPILAAGGLITGLITRYVAKGSRGYGVPDVMYAFEHASGRVPWRGTLSMALAIQSTLGFGASAGQEGPSVHIGGGITSLVGQTMRVSPQTLRLMLAGAAGGGLSALFNAPLAGSFFALELVLRRFTVRNFSGVVVASVLGNVVFRELVGPEEALQSPAYTLESGWEVFLYLGLGLTTAVFGSGFVVILSAVRNTRDWLPLGLLRPVLALTLVGIIGVWHDEILFTGKDQFDGFLANPADGQLLLTLAVLKIVATSLTVGGTGGAGGIMMPSLYIGATLGAAYGLFFEDQVPFATAPPGAYAVIGMAGLFAGAARAPFTAVMLGIETSQDYGLVVGLMTCVAVSMVISQLLTRESVYTDELKRIGVNIEQEQGPDPFERIPVRSAMSQSPAIFTPATSLEEAEAQFQRTSADAIPVLRELNIAGMVSAFDLIRAIEDGSDPSAAVSSVMATPPVTIRLDQSLQAAALKMDRMEVRLLAVEDEDGRYAGVLTRADMLQAYTAAREEQQETVNQLALMTTLEEPEARFMRVRLDEESPLVGRQLREMSFPEGSLIVSIRRRGRTIIPRGSVRLLTGDSIVILAEDLAMDELREMGVIADEERRAGLPRIWGLRGDR